MVPYSATQQIYTKAVAPCKYCLAGKCAERKAAGLCKCADHAETPIETKESPIARTSKESELATAS